MEAHPEPVQPDPTRERILDEAEKLFASKGFAAVSVRQIVNAANCHLGAVNYHFGSKNNLYLDVFRERWLPRSRRIRQTLLDLDANGGAEPEVMLRTAAQAFFNAYENQEDRIRHQQLMTREMAHPGEAFELVLREGIQPALALITKLLRPYLRPGVDEGKIRLCIFSVLGQLIYFNLARAPISRVLSESDDDKVREMIVEHVTSFCLNGLRPVMKDNGR